MPVAGDEGCKGGGTVGTCGGGAAVPVAGDDGCEGGGAVGTCGGGAAVLVAGDDGCDGTVGSCGGGTAVPVGVGTCGGVVGGAVLAASTQRLARWHRAGALHAPVGQAARATRRLSGSRLSIAARPPTRYVSSSMHSAAGRQA